jgi:hypothetical protein
MDTTSIFYKTTQLDGLKIFYREAGDPQAPAVLLRGLAAKITLRKIEHHG